MGLNLLRYSTLQKMECSHPIGRVAAVPLVEVAAHEAPKGDKDDGFLCRNVCL